MIHHPNPERLREEAQDLNSLPPCLSSYSEAETIVTVYVQPRASRTRITGLHDGNLRLALTAPPVDGKANRQVLGFMAKLFRVPKSAISIIAGEQGRTKKLSITGLSAREAAAALQPFLGQAA